MLFNTINTHNASNTRKPHGRSCRRQQCHLVHCGHCFELQWPQRPCCTPAEQLVDVISSCVLAGDGWTRRRRSSSTDSCVDHHTYIHKSYLYSAYKFKRVTMRFGRQTSKFSEIVWKCQMTVAAVVAGRDCQRPPYSGHCLWLLAFYSSTSASKHYFSAKTSFPKAIQHALRAVVLSIVL